MRFSPNDRASKKFKFICVCGHWDVRSLQTDRWVREAALYLDLSYLS